MASRIHVDDLHTYLESAKEKLSRERAELLALCPFDDELADPLNREEYAFAYVRAERLGMQAINRRLADVAWLPMQLDPKAEMMSDKRAGMKRWLNSSLVTHPGASEFGNDFIHALTRCGLRHGWDTPGFFKSAVRIANLFRDLSCLIGLVYYGTWLVDNQIETVRVTDPTNLCRTAEEITALVQSPEMYRLLRAREQQDDKPGKALADKKAATLPPPVTGKRKPPALRVIKNEAFSESLGDTIGSIFTPDPVLV